MHPLIDNTFVSFERMFTPPGATTGDLDRRTYLAISLMFLIPIIVGFGVEDLRQGHRIEGALVITMAIFLTGILVALAKIRDLKPIFRLAAAATLLFQLYELKIGGGDGYAFFWFYCIPVLAMTVFGQREGTKWVFAFLVSAALGFLTPFGHEYELKGVSRLLVIYAMVAIISYALESSRHRYYSELLEEKVALENALARVKTLRGLLPICATCKMVRDDRGYWQQIEIFIAQRSEAEFSHGLCPGCMTRLYPDLPKLGRAKEPAMS